MIPLNLIRIDFWLASSWAGWLGLMDGTAGIDGIDGWHRWDCWMGSLAWDRTGYERGREG